MAAHNSMAKRDPMLLVKRDITYPVADRRDGYVNQPRDLLDRAPFAAKFACKGTLD
jgi:hypothetical protein